MTDSSNRNCSPENIFIQAGNESTHPLLLQEKKTKLVSSDVTIPSPNLQYVENSLLEECNSSGDSLSINTLPDEIMEYIFSYLDIRNRIQVESVCKHWRWIGKTRPWSWPRSLSLKEDCGCSTPSVLVCEPLNNAIVSSILSLCGHCLRQLTLWYNKYSILLNVGQCCPNLTKINLYGIQFYNESCVRTLILGCAKLKLVKLYTCLVIRDKHIMNVLRECKALECLEIATVSFKNAITGECFKAINNSLNTLRLFNCMCLNSYGLEKLIWRCDSLQNLRLTYCIQVAPDMLMKVFRYYRNTLKTLLLEGYSEPLHWCEVVRMLCNLENLSVRYCRHVDNDVCKCIAANCTKLKVLSIYATGVTDEGLIYLKSIPSLVVLDISFLDLLGFGIEVLASQRRLETVYATNIRNLTDADQSFSFLARFCPNLHTLDVSVIEGVSNKLVDSFCQSLQCGQLKGPIKLGLEYTSVTEDVETCEGLELVFKNVESLYNADYQYQLMEYYYK